MSTQTSTATFDIGGYPYALLQGQLTLNGNSGNCIDGGQGNSIARVRLALPFPGVISGVSLDWWKESSSAINCRIKLFSDAGVLLATPMDSSAVTGSNATWQTLSTTFAPVSNVGYIEFEVSANNTNSWCQTWNFRNGTYGWQGYVPCGNQQYDESTTNGTWVDGQGFGATNCGPYPSFGVANDGLIIDGSSFLSQVEMEYTCTGGGPTVYRKWLGVQYPWGDDGGIVGVGKKTWSVLSSQGLGFRMYFHPYFGMNYIHSLTLYGTGPNPFSSVNNCQHIKLDNCVVTYTSFGPEEPTNTSTAVCGIVDAGEDGI